MDLRKFDKRIVARNLEKGTVEGKEYQKYMTDLKDLEGEYDVFEVQQPDQKNKRGEDVAANAVASDPAQNATQSDNQDG